MTTTQGSATSSQSFVWTVTPRVALVNPGPQANATGDAVSVQVNATSPSGTMSYSATGLPSGLSIGSTGLISGTLASTDASSTPYNVVVTANDGTSSSSQTFAWTVSAINLVSPGDQTNNDGDTVSLSLTTGYHGSGTLSYSATGLPPGMSINSGTGAMTGIIASSADANSPYSVTVTATDGTNTSSQTFNWTVNAVISFNALSDQSNAVGDVVSVQTSATDSLNNTLTYSATNSTTQTFLWTVSQVSLTAPSAQTNNEGDTVSLQLQGLASTGSLTYNASGLPAGLSLNATTGMISGTITSGDAAGGPYTVNVSASNGNVSTSQTFNWTVNPVVTLTAPADQTNNEGDSVSLQMSATDSLNNALTYAADGLPSGLSISSSGLITGTVSTGDAANGPYAVTVTASDGTYSSSQTFTWNVTHADTTALTMTNAGMQSNVAGDSVNLQINAGDPDGVDSLTYSASGLPDGLSIDPYAGTITGTIADDAVSNTPYTITVTADDGNGQTVSQTFTWLVNAPAITTQATPISAVEGNDTGSITVGTFTTADMNSRASDFTATVNWGDGNSDVGTVSGQNGIFTVTDDHTYTEMGSYPVSITIVDSATGASTTIATSATVGDATLTKTGGFQLGTLLGQSNNLTLATFTDGNPSASLSDYTATINWGDGSGNQTATIADSGVGVFSIGGAHNYNQTGTYTATITVTDINGATQTTTSTIVVGNVYAGMISNLIVASFQDSNLNVQASQFTATITWGDGTQSSGTVTGGYGTFTVQGTHTYTTDSFDQPNGVYAVSVSITDPNGNTLSGNNNVMVTRPPMGGKGDQVTDQPGVPLDNVQVAEFTVPNATDAASEFSATINWGDGTSSSGTIQELTSGLYIVLGSHNYQVSEGYTIALTLLQQWSGTFSAEEFLTSAIIDNKTPGIMGPAAVPGNSIYNYTIYNIGKGYVPTTPIVQYAKNGNFNSLSSASGFAYLYSAPKLIRGTTWYQFQIFFFNRPAWLQVTENLTKQDENGKKLIVPLEERIKLVQIQVTSPTSKSPFSAGKPWDNTNLQAWSGLKNVAFPTDAGVVSIPSKDTTAYQFKLLPSGENPATNGGPGFAWSAQVTTVGPMNANEKRASGTGLQIGFIQHLKAEAYYAVYKNSNGQKTTLVSPMSNTGHNNWLDIATGVRYGEPIPNYAGPKLTWYLYLPKGYDLQKDQQSLLPKNVQSSIFTPEYSFNKAIIGAFDTPMPPFPWISQYNQKMPASPYYLSQMYVKIVFTTDVAARVTDTGSGNDQSGYGQAYDYWPQARVNWSLQTGDPADGLGLQPVSIRWMKGANNPPEGLPWSPNSTATVTPDAQSWSAILPPGSSNGHLMEVPVDGFITSPDAMSTTPERAVMKSNWANSQLWILKFVKKNS